MTLSIPVFRPRLNELSRKFATDALWAGEISGTSGHYLLEFEREFAAYCGVKEAVAVSSGSTALHLACVIAGITHGDEVLVSALTNIATANAVVQCGGVVVPIDSDPDTWNMNTDLLKAKITSRTKAIIPVHIYGHPVDMAPIHRLARKYNLIVIEDAAEAHGAEYLGARAGSLGDMGCFSFYANKIITTGEGGMLTTSNSDFADRARYFRNLAFGSPRFLHRDVAFNYRLTNLQAAIGLGQLREIEDVIQLKRDLAYRYIYRLQSVPGLALPVEREWARNVYWMFSMVVLPTFGISRDELMRRLLAVGIETRTMFCPLNLQPALMNRGAVNKDTCPIAENLWDNGLYLPSDPYLSDRELDWICNVIAGCVP